MEEKISFQSDGFQIEGLLSQNTGDRGVVITHPHPQYGGDMHNNVVASLQRVYQENGYTTLRFNFRGVGASQGSFDDGRGEQSDVNAALEHLTNIGMRTVDLAGYSFGSWVNARVAAENTSIQNLVMVSPPVDFMNFTDVESLPCLRLVVVGSQDDFASAEAVEKAVSAWNPDARMEVIEGCDHFYFGYSRQLESILKTMVSIQQKTG
ncbi:MAG: alpha/beta hydrolase [Proteobacteria bacterium]|nr:alpha/beta hydrolase [Pseudomonadota bacterium]